MLIICLLRQPKECGHGPFNAISWIFKTEDRAIILEDDCVAELLFFNYCSDLLERYKNDTRIWDN